jgi:hypothetical protein
MVIAAAPSEPLGAHQRRDHVSGDDDRADAPEDGNDHRHILFNAAARAAKSTNAPPPNARKIRSVIADASSSMRPGGKQAWP